jgi:isochorismate hydrolase
MSMSIALRFGASGLEAQLPKPGMQIDPTRTALLITDPQNDFLSGPGHKYRQAPRAQPADTAHGSP